MDSKSTHSYLAHLAWIIPSVIALVGIALDHMDLASLLFSKIWNLLFVNVWYLWLAAAGLGLYRFVRLIQNLHNLTNKEIPALKTAHDENRSWTKELVDKESRSRVAADDTLSARINSLDTQSRKDLTDGLTAARSQLSELVRKEAHERTGGINAILQRHELDFERMNRIETSLPQQFLGRIKEIETKLAAQITDLNKRLDKAEPPPALDLETFKGLINSPSHVPTPDEAFSDKGLGVGLINSVPRVPTPAEAMAKAIMDRNKNKKGT